MCKSYLNNYQLLFLVHVPAGYRSYTQSNIFKGILKSLVTTCIYSQELMEASNIAWCALPLAVKSLLILGVKTKVVQHESREKRLAYKSRDFGSQFLYDVRVFFALFW